MDKANMTVSNITGTNISNSGSAQGGSMTFTPVNPRQGVCPNCGYCPHCGQSKQSFTPYVYPFVTWGTSPSTGVVTCSSNDVEGSR